MEAASGVPYIRNSEHTFQLISTAGPGGTNTCTLVVDGFTIRSGIEYFISGSDNIRMGWVKTSSADIYYDDIYVKLKGIAYAEWTDEKGLAEGVNNARSDDPDTDGMNNLTEYALGGDPLLDDAASILPTFAIMDAGGGSNFMDYVYNRRLDAADRGLAYGLNVSTNLQSDWIYVGNAYETGSAGIDPSFESVSNSIPVSGVKGFVNLEITEE
ncbi:MAG: hypothetical protein DRP64_04840 [Verrucomicrobia bacterium]|nr:MAG: hypothetical protein DRP64_04840 [Verrucomicrobiota bacterium]